LRRLVTYPEHCRAMGQASRKRIAKWSFTQDWEGLLQALTHLGPPQHAH